MKTIHIHVEDENGIPQCWEARGSFIKVVRTLFLIWRNSNGVLISSLDEEDDA